MPSDVAEPSVLAPPALTVRQQAEALAAAGISFCPIAARHDKRPDSGVLPAVYDPADGRTKPSWKPFQSDLPTARDIAEWYGGHAVRGIAVIGGSVSGNLEILDSDEVGYKDFTARLLDLGFDKDLWRSVPLWQTPSHDKAAGRLGGWQVMYRCESLVGGNRKLAFQKKMLPGKEDGARQDEHGDWYKPEVMMETRGEGGYAIVPPSPAACHPDNRPYKLLRGTLAAVQTLTAEQRAMIHAAAGTFATYSPETQAFTPRESKGKPAVRDSSLGKTSWEDYNERGDYETLLERHGWRPMRQSGERIVWARPGKQDGGISATSNYAGLRLFHVFSSNAAPFTPEKSHSPFAVYGLLEHNGDFKAAARQLGKDGYGDPLPPRPSNGQYPQNNGNAPMPQNRGNATMPQKQPPMPLSAPDAPRCGSEVAAGDAEGECASFPPCDDYAPVQDSDSGGRGGATGEKPARGKEGQGKEGHGAVPDAEAALLRLLLVGRVPVRRALSSSLTAAQFFCLPYGNILTALCALYNADTPINAVTVLHALAGSSEKQMASALLAPLPEDAAAAAETDLSAFAAYVRIVQGAAQQRRVVAAASALLSAASLPSADALSLAALTAEELAGVRAGSGSGPMPLSAAVEAFSEDLDARQENPELFAAAPTGLRDLDAFLDGGLWPGLTVIGGTPSMGKSAFAASLVSHLAGVKNKRVLFYSLETKRQSFVRRLVGSLSGIPQGVLKRGVLSDDESERRYAAEAKVHGWPVHLQDRAETTVADVRADILALRGQGLAMVVIDFLGLLHLGEKAENRTKELEIICQKLAETGHALGIPVVALSQIGRGVESRQDKRPSMSDLRDSQGIEIYADLALLLYREDYYAKKDGSESVDPSQVVDAEVIVAKNRDGRRGMVKIGFQPATARFSDYEIVRADGSTGF